MGSGSRWFLVMATALAVGFAGCGEDDDGGDGGIDGDVERAGIPFSAANAERCASVAIAALSPFPEIGQAAMAIMAAIEDHGTEAPGLSPRTVIDLGDIGLCSSGSSRLSWNDSDGNGTLSAGDEAVLTLTDCDGSRSGTLELEFTAVTAGAATAELSLAITIEETVDGEPESGTLSGRFRMDVERFPSETVPGILRFQVDEPTDGAQGLTGTLNGKTEYELGCFNLYYSLALGSPYYTLSEPYGVLSIPDLGYASFASFGLPGLVFPEGTYPQSGALRLMAFAAVTPCTGVKVSGDGVNGNDSVLILTATGGGTVTLSGQTPAGEPYSVQTTWGALD